MTKVKPKELIWSIILNAFLGYLWILFMNNVLTLTQESENFLVKGLIFILGTYLFAEIVIRNSPYRKYKTTHPVKIVGFASFLSVVIVDLFLYNVV